MEKSKLSKYLVLFVLSVLVYPFFNNNAKDCYPTPPNPELIVNGNFELNFYGFNTTYDTSFIKFPKNIKITRNPYLEYYTFDSCSDPVMTNGKFLIVNGNDIFDGLQIVWEQEVSILPNTYYEFKYMYTNIDAKVDTNKNLPIIQVSFNEEFFDTVYVPKETCLWNERSFIWYSGRNNKLTIRIRDIQLKYFGNDFALDEISLKSLCSVQACAGQDIEMCAGDTVILGDVVNQSAIQGFKPYSYRWYPEYALSSPFVPNPLAFPEKTTTYYLEVTDSLGCVSTDSITIVVHSKPLAKITANKSLPLCPCDSVILQATEGLNYLWSTGETSSSIVVKEKGYYTLRVVNSFGCIDTSGIWVDTYPVSTTIKLDTIVANIGEKITLPIKLVNETNYFVCSYDSFKVSISYNPSVLFPINLKPSKFQDNREFIEIIGKSSSYQIDSLIFFVTLGNDTASTLFFEQFLWNCDKVDVQTTNGMVIVENICREAGHRLFDLGNTFYFSEVPSPITGEINLTFYAIEKGHTELKILNYLGEIVKIPFSNVLEPGIYELKISTKELSNGLYYLIFDTPTNRVARSLIILN